MMIPRKRTYTGSGTRAPPTRRRKTSAAGRRLPYTAMRVSTAPLATRSRAALSEIKSFDCPFQGGNIPSPGAISSGEPALAFRGITEVNCIPQGATVANRIGNKVIVKSVHARILISAAPGAATQEVARVMLVYDRQPNGAFPAIGDILLDQPAGTTNLQASINIANKSRFTILRDQRLLFDQGRGTTNYCDWYIKGRWEVEFGATTGNIGDFRTGSILFIAYLPLATGATVTMTQPGFRIRYFD